ncbi:hypothetical protein PIB30_022364 [Stylosanthes scabra]|uniref:Uncharacterized protein n=1 Tax=Stylosanthes scabra TaxID=79078 RepID=A0ABU6W915_9FABA|nr:hypothetical protein [Stylosanthes scabra]
MTYLGGEWVSSLILVVISEDQSKIWFGYCEWAFSACKLLLDLTGPYGPCCGRYWIARAGQAQYPEQLPQTQSVSRFLEASCSRRVRLDITADVSRLFDCGRGRERTSVLDIRNSSVLVFSKKIFYLHWALLLQLSQEDSSFSGEKMTDIPQDEQLAVMGQGAVAAQMLHELPDIYQWVTRDVLVAPSTLSQEYLDELKSSGVLFGGGDLERRYRVEAASPNERVCFLNLNHLRVPNWLWVNEVMFTEFGIQIPFSNFQQRLLNRSSIAPSQLHPNAWSAIRCFELVTEFLQLP